MEIDAVDVLSQNEISIVGNEDVEYSVDKVQNQEQNNYPCLFTSKTLIELSSSSWSRHKSANESMQPYLRGCKWSPDGTCCLSVVHNDGVHVTELSRDLYTGDVTPDRIIDVMDSVVHVKEAGLIYDFCWFPFMNSSIPVTCCWLTTRQNAPVQMWDAFDGSLRCTYRGYDQVDEVESAISLTFSTDGSRIIAGYKKVIRTFDVERPGRNIAEHKIHSPAACFDTSNNLLAVGSWNTSISLYSINEMGGYKSIGKMHGHGGGVTQVKFMLDGIHLVSGARRDHRLLVWDLRNYRKPLNILSRVVNTNQRVYFDISPCGRHLVSGGTDGVLKVWDDYEMHWKDGLDPTGHKSDTATYKFPLHEDCCNSVSIHPLRPILATGSGQFHLIDPMRSPQRKSSNGVKSENETSMNVGEIKGENSDIKEENKTSVNKDDKESDDSSNETERLASVIDVKYSERSENSLVFWWIGNVAA